MLRRGMGCLLVLAALLCTGPSWAQTKMTIATGVDPVFSAYYVAQQEGLFKKHELDVRINTGPSGSAMVAFLVNGQIESAFGSEIAGVANHNLDPNVVVVAQATRLCGGSRSWAGTSTPSTSSRARRWGSRAAPAARCSGSP